MKQVETSIVIQAKPEEIWKKLITTHDYASWNPFISKIEGNLQEGKSINVTMKLNGGKPTNFSPTILKRKENEEFRWIGHLWFKGLFDGEHYFIIKPIDSNHSKLIHGEKFKGILLFPLWNSLKPKVTASFQSMNNALKEKVEEERGI